MQLESLEWLEDIRLAAGRVRQFAAGSNLLALVLGDEPIARDVRRRYDPSVMIVHLARESPVTDRDLAQVTSALRERNTLVGVRNPSADWYDPMWYLREQQLNGMTFTLLVDRNVYSHAVALTDSKRSLYTDEHRVAAGVLCFAHCCQLQIETKIALLEHELDGSESSLNVELPRFRRAFAAGPTALADFALGRTDTLALASQGDASARTDNATVTEEDRPSTWRLNYGCALKMACLVLDSHFTTDVDRFLAYLQWCYDEFYFSSGPTVYGSLALSPKRKAGMFKRLRGSHASEAMRGVRNATWDMTLVSEWEIRQQEMPATKNHYLLCTFDRALTDVANTVMCQGLDEWARSDLVRERFVSEWGKRDGIQVFGRYMTLAHTVDSDDRRPANQQRPRAYWDGQICLLERELRYHLGSHP